MAVGCKGVGAGMVKHTLFPRRGTGISMYRRGVGMVPSVVGVVPSNVGVSKLQCTAIW